MKTVCSSLQKSFSKVFAKTVEGGRWAFRQHQPATTIENPSKPDKVHNVYGDFSAVMAAIGWRFYGEICWFKQNSVGRRGMKFGSDWPSAMPNIRRQHEYILIFYKGHDWETLTNNRSRIDLTEDEYRAFIIAMVHQAVFWLPANNDFYHPAVFPEEIPYRLCKMLSYVGNTIFRSICWFWHCSLCRARALQRHFIGIDNGPTYVYPRSNGWTMRDGQSPTKCKSDDSSVCGPL